MSTTLSELFSDPFDPQRSLQLNNRYWPGERFTLLPEIAEAEAVLEHEGPAAAVRYLQFARRIFAEPRVFGKFLHRVHRLWSSRSSFGHITGCIQLPTEVIAANRYTGAETQCSYALTMKTGFSGLDRQTKRIYSREYGRDAIRVLGTVRFAKPSERLADTTNFGNLSDFHNDEYKGITTIIYLDTVRNENGAFSYIVDSNRISRSLILSAIHQTVEWDMGLSGPDKLGGLPLEFRGSMAIGNYLDHEKVDALCRFRKILEGDAGTYVTFNGQYLLHRGGKPALGSRLAAFMQPEGLIRLKLKGLGSLLFGLRHR